MLSTDKMVKNAIEKMYTGKCTITERQKYTKENKSIGFKEVKVQENVPCKLSFESLSAADGVNVSQGVKIFITQDIVIKPGSKITVTQAGRTTDYKQSGEPAVYSTHQEIKLNLFEEYV